MEILSPPDRVKELFHTALERQPHQRPTFLASACAGDAGLRQEVESLLSLVNEHPDFLQTPVFELSAADIASQVLKEDEEPSIIGELIGPYRIIREIGRGGMGAVYLAARDDGHYDQQVALKLVKRGMDSEDVLHRFRRERQILANLAHANISRLLDGGMTTEGRLYFVMEYVEGLRIDEYANAQRLSTTERLEIFLAVCAAVQYTHRHNIIHRDLKPGNILITADGTPKLLDFGIAKLLDREHKAPSSAETAAALRLLTPEYASPEQLGGLPLSASSDVYSLGVVLYELLTGHRPHRFSGGQSSSEMIQAIATQEPEKPSTVIIRIEGRSSKRGTKAQTITLESVSAARDRAPERLRRSLRGDLDNIVLMALRNEPHRRYVSVEEFSSDIRHHLKGMPILARKDTLSNRGAKFLKRHKMSALATLTAALLCLLLGVLLANMFSARPVPRESIAVLPLVNANNNPGLEHLADGVTDTLIETLSRMPKLTVPRHESVFRFKGQTLDPQTAGAALKVETILKGTITSDGQRLSINLSLINTGSAQIIWSKQYDGFLSDLLRIQEQIADDVSRNLGVERSNEVQTQLKKRYTENAEAYRLYLLGRYFWNKRTKESFHKGIEYFRGATEKDPSYALAYSGLADCYGLLGAYMVSPPGEIFPAAKAAALKAIELDEGLAEGHTSLALTLWLYDWDWESADAEFRRAIELNPRYVTAHHWRGLFLGEMGRFDEAEAEMQQAWAYDPISAPVLADFGRVYFWARKYDKALEKYHKAREINSDFGAYNIEATELYEQIALDEKYSTFEKLGWFMGKDRKAYLTSRSYRRKDGSLEGFGYTRAEKYARLGAKDRAFSDLNDAFRSRDHRMTHIKVNPRLDSLRSDPRFAELLRRMNLTMNLPNSRSAVVSGIR